MEDLETVNPGGRLDVLAYRGVHMLAKQVEQQNGLSGIWDALKPHVNQLLVEHVGNIELPTEAKILLTILQANYKKEG